METIKSLEWYTEHNAGRIWTCLDPCECLIYDYCWKGSEYLLYAVLYCIQIAAASMNDMLSGIFTAISAGT